MTRKVAERIVDRCLDAAHMGGWGDPICRACGGAGSRPVKGERCHARCTCADRVELAFKIAGSQK